MLNHENMQNEVHQQHQGSGNGHADTTGNSHTRSSFVSQSSHTNNGITPPAQFTTSSSIDNGQWQQNSSMQSSLIADANLGQKFSVRRIFNNILISVARKAKQHSTSDNNMVGMRGAAENSTTNNNSMEIRFNEKEYDVLGKYNDFETIDWVRDLRRDRQRHYALQRRTHGGGNSQFSAKFLYNRLIYYYDAASAWFCLLLVAVLAALVAGFIDIASTWLTNLTTGLCWPQFWFNREQCCWSSNETLVVYRSTNDSATRCANWQPWSELIFKQSELSGIGGSLLQYVSFVSCSVIVAALAAQIVHTFAPYASGSGISEIKTILSGFVIQQYLGLTTLLIKSFTLVLAVASGLVLGKEGPLVHVACCCGNVITRLFPKFAHNEAKKREILSAAAACGVAVAFGAPLGGVLFSLEEVSYYFPLKTLWRSFFCALLGALILRTINPFGNSHLVIFYIDYHAPWRMFELIPFVMLGILGGVLGALYIKANHLWCRYRKESSLGRWPRTEIIVMALLTALVSFHNPYTRASLSSIIEKLYQRCSPADDGVDELCDYSNNAVNSRTVAVDAVSIANISNNHTIYTGTGQAGPGVHRALWQLAIALCVKLILWVFTVGMKIPTGLFIPSLAIGAILGRLLGIGVEQAVYAACLGMHDDAARMAKCLATNTIQPGIYAMLGSAALMAGVTRMTVTLVVMMLEVTGGLEYIVPLMVAVMVAKWAGDWCGPMSIYDVHIDLNTYPYLDHKNYAEDLVLSNDSTLSADGNGGDDVVARDIMTPSHYKYAESSSSASSSALPPTLLVVTQHNMTVRELDELCATQRAREPHGVLGFPVVVSRTSPYAVGFVLRRELQLALDKLKQQRSRDIDDFDADNILVAFVRDEREQQHRSATAATHIQLANIVDLAPVTVSVQTTIEIIIDLFRKLGLRHILVTHNGRLCGIITKKDVVRFLKRRTGGGGGGALRTRVLSANDSTVDADWSNVLSSTPSRAYNV